MKANEILLEHQRMLTEEMVMSSWIMDLTYDEEQEAVIMTLLSGRSYSIAGVEEDLYDMWIGASSKGKFWHQAIKGNYFTTRIA